MTFYSKTLCSFGFWLLITATAAAPVHASQMAGSQYIKQAHVKSAKARTIALKACSGKIVSVKLEKESGGSGLRYSFDIRKKGGGVHKVGIDAKTGKILEDSIDDGKD